jgi:D-alanyl-D-alanine carboxypeptidase
MVDKVEKPQDLQPEDLQIATPIMDDIPEARRETPVHHSRSAIGRSRLLLAVLGLGVVVAIAVVVGVQQATPPSSATANVETDATVTNQPDPSDVATIPENTEEVLLGHRAYEEAPLADLKPIVPDDSIQLRTAAADQFMAMVADAEADGVIILPLSGFRSYEDQKYLFFDVKAERAQNARTRAEVSAPPGYSEHHTGYAVDVIDGTRPDTDLQISFETTPAYQWMQQNAARYGFELSFPRDNPQNIQYEPWHWRFVGDPESLETFYREQQPVNPAASPSGAANDEPTRSSR